MENDLLTEMATASDRQEHAVGQKITPFLWFNGNIKEALDFYTGIFKQTKIIHVQHYGDGWPGSEGKIMTATVELEGQLFMAIDGGPQFTFSPAISFFVNCTDQEEVDFLWEKLSDGGEKQNCGWLKDKFGLSWQIIPTALGTLMGDRDPEKSRRVMQAMLQMEKIDIQGLQKAYHQE